MKRLVIKPKQTTRRIRQKGTQESHTITPAERGGPRKNRVGTRQKLRPGMQKGQAPPSSCSQPSVQSTSHGRTPRPQAVATHLRTAAQCPSSKQARPYQLVAAANPKQNPVATLGDDAPTHPIQRPSDEHARPNPGQTAIAYPGEGPARRASRPTASTGRSPSPLSNGIERIPREAATLHLATQNPASATQSPTPGKPQSRTQGKGQRATRTQPTPAIAKAP